MNTPTHPLAKEAIAIHGPIAVNRKQTDALREIQENPQFDGWLNTKQGDNHDGNYMGEVSCDQCEHSFILLLNPLYCEIDIFNEKAKEEYSESNREKLRNALKQEHEEMKEHRNVYPLRDL